MNLTARICRTVMICAFIIILAGCVSDGAPRSSSEKAGADNKNETIEIVDPATPAPKNVTKAINDLGFNILRRTSDTKTNTVISPYSISSILTLTSHGARGTTAEEMRQALGYDRLSETDVKRQWAELNNDLAERSPAQKLKTANAMWPRRGLNLKRDFKATGRTVYGAEIRPLDFGAGNPVITVVNSWFKKKTNGMIPRMVEEIDGNTVLLLTNAVYFKGKWEIPFEPDQTDKRPFTLPDGSRVKVPMMSRWDDSLQSIDTSSFAMVRLPYKGADSAMYLLLPNDENGLKDIERTLTGKEFLSAARDTAASDPHELMLGLPRLKLNWGKDDFQETLKAMGMRAAFDSSLADFDGIAEVDPLYISQFIHKTRVKVGELGTEAAAGSYIALCAGGPPPTAIFDRPFIFSIIDEKSGTILFLGEVNDPRAK